jgi:DNA polymerase III delta prime subunit
MGGSYSPTHRLILAIVVLSVISVACAYWVSGPLALLLSIFICALIWLLRPIVMPSHHGDNKVRFFSLIAFFALANSYGFWSDLVNQLIQAISAEPAVAQVAPWLKHISLDNGPSIALLGISAVVVLGVNYFLRDKSIPGQHPDRFDKDFPELTFEKERKAFCSALDQHLITTDREANWSPEYYTDLDAEVEIQNAIGSTHRKRIADLQQAIRRDRSTQSFLILGDPGSGKSVALRKLARDMLKQTESTHRIPIYVNLREWLRDGDGHTPKWSETSKPEPKDLEDFVIRSLKSRGDVFTEEFVDKYFRKLWQHGRLFFLFDSFDEIPELLDSNEESWLIESLSNVISRFINSNHLSRGILASRVYRRPTQSFLAGKILDIRPMSEEKIIAAIGRHPEFTQNIKVKLFRDRLDLVPIIRNPLLASLLGEWIKKHHDLPENQADLYRDYLSGRLKKCESKIAQFKLSVEEVMQGACEIAWFIYDSPAYGLEAPVQVIGENSGDKKAYAIIEILSYARIARVSQSEPKSFAFSHRRFLEFFVTTRLLATPYRIPFEHIPTDSRGRDALALYAQICDEASSRQLAEHCWKEVETSFNAPETHLRAIHSLRFLIDAFRSHRHVLAGFAPELTELIQRHTTQGGNLLHAKICLEGTGLLPDQLAAPILKSAMQSSNIWLQETAFRSCRQLPKIDTDLQASITEYVLSIPITHLWKNRKSMDFGLSLSESLRSPRKIANFRAKNFALSSIAIVIAVCIFPLLIALPVIAHFSHFLLFEGISKILDFRDAAQKLPSHDSRNSLTPDKFIESVRFFSPVFLVMIASLIMLGDFSKNADLIAGGYRWIPLKSFAFSAMPAAAMSTVALVLALSICEMILLRNRFFSFFSTVKIKSAVPFAIGLLMALILITFFLLGTIWLLEFLHEFLPKNIGDMLLFFLRYFALPLVFSIFPISAITFIMAALKEQRAFSKLSITEKMSRQDIVSALNALRSERKRLALVKKLNEKRVIATGDWPPDFKLSITSSPSLTELAKLEERWLGLDR